MSTRSPIPRALSVILAVLPSIAHADFYDSPFEVRLFLAVDRQSNYSSTLARQASLAAFDGGSANPAAAAWRAPPAPDTTVTASLVYAPATGGRTVIAEPVSLRWQSRGQGSIAFAYAHTDTNDAAGDDGFVRMLRSDEWIGGYGRRIDDTSAVGFTFRLTDGRIINDFTAAPGGQPSRAETRFLALDVAVGYAAQLSESMTFGLVGGYSRASTQTTVTNLTPLSIFLPAAGLNVTLPPGTVLAQPDDTVALYSIRGGVGFRTTDSTAVYADAIALRVATHNSGSQNLGRFAIGIDHMASRSWIARGGVGLDTLGKVNASAGLGYRPNELLELQFAVQSNAAPEVNPEIGRTLLLSGSLAWRF